MRFVKCILLIALVIISGCICGSTSNNRQSYKQKPKQNVETKEIIPENEMIIVNPCIGSDITLWSGIEQPKQVVGKIPDCDSIKVQVLKRKCSKDGLEFDYIKYNNIEGWQTRRLLTCPESKNQEGCWGASDSICPSELEELKLQQKQD